MASSLLDYFITLTIKITPTNKSRPLFAPPLISGKTKAIEFLFLGQF